MRLLQSLSAWPCLHALPGSPLVWLSARSFLWTTVMWRYQLIYIQPSTSWFYHGLSMQLPDFWYVFQLLCWILSALRLHLLTCCHRLTLLCALALHRPTLALAELLLAGRQAVPYRLPANHTYLRTCLAPLSSKLSMCIFGEFFHNYLINLVFGQSIVI